MSFPLSEIIFHSEIRYVCCYVHTLITAGSKPYCTAPRSTANPTPCTYIYIYKTSTANPTPCTYIYIQDKYSQPYTLYIYIYTRKVQPTPHPVHIYKTSTANPTPCTYKIQYMMSSDCHLCVV